MTDPAQPMDQWTELWTWLSRMTHTGGYSALRSLDMHSATSGDMHITSNYKGEHHGGSFNTLDEAIELAKTTYREIFGEPGEPRTFSIHYHDEQPYQRDFLNQREMKERLWTDEGTVRRAWERGHASNSGISLTEVKPEAAQTECQPEVSAG